MKKMTNYYIKAEIPWIQGNKDVKTFKWTQNVFPERTNVKSKPC